MAPPSPRRPGFSRQAQLSLFAAYVLAIVGALVSLLFVASARLDPKGHAALQSAASDVTVPFTSALSAVVNTASDISSGASAYFDAASKNREMARELESLRRKQIKSDAYALENKRLKQLLAIVEPRSPRPIVARIASSSSTSSRRYATLAAGAARGVEVGQPVRAADGLVGRIVQRGQLSALVLMIIDSQSIVPVKRLRDGVPALAIGLGDGRLEIRALAAGSNPFRPGDIFITSGTGGIYAPGIPVATAVRRTRDQTFARPLALPETLDYATVESIYVAPMEPPATDGASAG
jgi:rod shape-determining protein MreC